MRLQLAAFGLASSLLWVAGTGCTKTSGSGAAKEDMQLAPKETDVVFMANFTRLRNTDMWKKAVELRDSDANTKKDYDDFVKKCELDPFKQIDSIFVGFPQTVGESKEFVAVLRGTFNEQKLVECAKEQAKKDGADVTATDYNGHKLYSSTKQGQAYASFLDGKTVVLAGKEWIKKAIDLASKKEAGASAKDNEALNVLLKRANTNAGLWGAGLVPQTTRDQLKANPQTAVAGSMKDVFGSIDFQKGFLAELNVDLGTKQDAADLAAKVNAQIADARKSPQLMMAGLNSFLDQVKVDSKESTFHTNINFSQQQVDDLINRVKGLLGTLRSSLGGGAMGAPGGGLPPPQPTP